MSTAPIPFWRTMSTADVEIYRANVQTMLIRAQQYAAGAYIRLGYERDQLALIDAELTRRQESK